MEKQGIHHSPNLGSSGELGSVKGILKKAPATQHQVDENAPRLKWDEESLMITEAQKDSTMKIDEPKTPFVYYDHENDRVIDPEDMFMLDGPRKNSAALAHTPPVPSYLTGLNDDDEDEDDDEDDDDDRDQDPDEWLDSDDEYSSSSSSKPKDMTAHDRFARMRAEHYNMREAMKLGQQLTEDEEDEDEDEEEERKARSSSASGKNKGMDMEL
ncbi:hypothetical protein BGX34_004483 [Mortierella sp. NVP85]|nr:hypothetical protein BGX34_004483 [Mortierella sp. NVP85]